MARSKRKFFPTPDADNAVDLARAGKCKDAMAALWDALPSSQTECSDPGYLKHRAASKRTFVIVTQLCVRPQSKRREYRPSEDAFLGRGRKKRKR